MKKPKPLSHLATQRDQNCVIAAAFGLFVNHTAGQPGLAGQPGNACKNHNGWRTKGSPNLMIMETNMKKLILTLSGLTGGLMALGLVNVGTAGLMAIPANAQDAAKEMDFVKVDADANGKVTPEEALAAGWTWTPEQFAAADRDTDGSLSADEFVTATKT